VCLPVILSVGMAAGGLEDRISSWWEGERYLLRSHEKSEWLIVLCRLTAVVMKKGPYKFVVVSGINSTTATARAHATH